MRLLSLLAPAAQLVLLATVAGFSLRHVELPALFAAPAAPARSVPVVSDLARFPGIVAAKRAAKVRPLNTALDRLGPGRDAPGGADRPLDAWEKLDHWSLGYMRRYDLFFGDDF